MTNAPQITTAKTPQSIAVEVEQTVHSFFDLHTQMADLLNEENDILTKKDFSALSEITERKGPVIAAYQDALRYLQHNSDVVKSLSHDIKSRLSAMRQEMAELTTNNMSLLDRAMNSSNRVVEMITKAMQDSRRTSTFYGSGGAVTDGADVSTSFKVNSVV